MTADEAHVAACGCGKVLVYGCEDLDKPRWEASLRLAVEPVGLLHFLVGEVCWR